jgi:hypothetical protein
VLPTAPVSKLKFANADPSLASLNCITEYSPFLAKMLKDKLPEFVELNFIACLPLVVPAISLSEFCIFYYSICYIVT